MSIPKWAPVFGAAALIASASAPAWAKPPVEIRMQNQQMRIERGIRSGALTPDEAARLQAQQDGIREAEARMRDDHDGRLTLADRERLQQRLNRADAAIKELTHNDEHGPGSGAGG